jgi:hypothetical protein
MASVDTTDRGFTPFENDIYSIRKTALELANKDDLFQIYENTNLNLIPLIEGDSKKVFVLTGPQKNNVVIFGNDYLITFDKDNKVASKKRLHKNIIPIEYTDDGKIEDSEVQGTLHSHLPETGDLITSTDICTLMLYGKFAGWKTHTVVSQKYICIWSCEGNTLAVVAKDAMEKINKDQKKSKEKKDKSE